MKKRMSRKSLLPLGAGLLSLSAMSWADIVFDGTTGTTGAATGGPDFVISETDGLVSGGTLVHSFSEFSVASTESATFTGSPDINLLLNRVTGSAASNINGAITSDLVNADFYFLNPNGVIFGSEASINVPGAFTVSTASRLSIDGANPFDFSVNGDIGGPNADLTIADPEQLTFIFDNEPASINLQPGANLNNFEDLTLVSSAINAESETVDVGEVVGANLESFGGTISLGTSDSEFSFDPASASFPSGEIRLKDASVAAGNFEGGAGTVRIVGGELVMDGGDLFLVSGLERSQFTASGDIELSNGYSADMQPLSTVIEPGLQPDVGGIVFDAANISIDSESSVSTRTSDAINGLPINLNARNIRLTGGSVLVSDTVSSGRGGDIRINASGRVLMAGRGEVFGSLIRAATADLPDIGEGGFVPAGFGEGESGDIRISANEILMRDGALISSLAAEAIGAEIPANTGDISLNANRLSLAGNSVIETLAEASAGGNVDIRVAEVTDILNSTIRADAQGALPENPGANILINTGSLFFQNAAISANATGGNGGNITIITNRIIQDPATSITASGNRRVDGNSSIDGLVNEDAGNEIEEEAFSTTTVFPDVTKLLSQRCSAANLTDRSSFVVSDDKPKAAPTSYELAQVGEGHSEARLNLMASCFY